MVWFSLILNSLLSNSPNRKMLKKFKVHQLFSCNQETPCIVEMPSDDDEDARTTSQEATDDRPNMSDEIPAESEQKKIEDVEKSSDEKQSTSYVANSGKMILPSDEGVLLFELKFIQYEQSENISSNKNNNAI